MSAIQQAITGYGGASSLSVSSVFSAYAYTGNGGTNVINNGIDLAGQGGMVWIKGRDTSYNHGIFDTLRGVTKELRTNLTAGEQTTTTDFASFNSNGFKLGAGGVTTDLNVNSSTYVGWAFRKAPKFFDVVTYSGTGNSMTVNHSLGVVPGMIIIKNTSIGSTNWAVWHRSTTGQYLLLNTTDAASSSSAEHYFGNSTTTVNPTSTLFRIGGNGSVNNAGNTHVAYLFAHDPDPDGIIQCGSFTSNGSGGATVTLGWEPQFLMVKGASTAGNWIMLDTARGFPDSGASIELYANTTAGDTSQTFSANKTSTGFTITGRTASQTYIYMAIRKP